MSVEYVDDVFDTVQEQDEQQEYKNPIFADNIQFKFIYQKSSHLKEWLVHIQSKDTCHIPNYVIKRVRFELKVMWVKKHSELTTNLLRKILKKNRLSHFYERVPHIRNILTGEKFEIPPLVEKKILAMFNKIQGPFLTHKPLYRSSLYFFCLT